MKFGLHGLLNMFKNLKSVCVYSPKMLKSLFVLVFKLASTISAIFEPIDFMYAQLKWKYSLTANLSD